MIDPDNHVVLAFNHHVAVATGSRQVHIAGQVSWDHNGELVAPGDLAGQVAQVYRNVATSLEARERLAGPFYADHRSAIRYQCRCHCRRHRREPRLAVESRQVDGCWAAALWMPRPSARNIALPLLCKLPAFRTRLAAELAELNYR